MLRTNHRYFGRNMEPNRLPNAIVAGAPKCGTSSLYFWLSAHPEVCASPVKETFFFADEVNRFNLNANCLEHRLERYAEYFQKCSKSPVRLEATAPYIYYQNALERIPSLPSNPKVFFVLREPSARLYSQYRFERFRTKRIQEDWGTYAQRSELRLHGDYIHYLTPWLEALGPDRIHVSTFEALVKNPQEAVKDMARFLGIDPEFYASYDFVQHNETVAIKNKSMHRAGLALQRYVPHRIQEALLPLYLRLNAGKMPAKDPGDAAITKAVKAEYAPSVAALQAAFPKLDLSPWA